VDLLRTLLTGFVEAAWFVCWLAGSAMHDVYREIYWRGQEGGFWINALLAFYTVVAFLPMLFCMIVVSLIEDGCLPWNGSDWDEDE